MKDNELKKLFDDSTTDDKVDLAKLNIGINEAFNKVITTKVENATKNIDYESTKKQAVDDFLKTNEFESQDAFTSFVKNSKKDATVDTEKSLRLTNENAVLIKERDKLKIDFGVSSKELTGLKRMGHVRDAKVTKDYRKFVISEVAGSLKDDEKFKDKLPEFIKDNPQYVGEIDKANIGKKAGGKGNLSGLEKFRDEYFK